MTDDSLDPSQVESGPETNMGAAGIPTPAPQPGTPPPDLKISEDGNIIEREGRKYVPFEALSEERKARQALNQTLQTLEPVLPEFKEFLRLKELRSQPPAVQPPAGGDEEYSNEDLEGVALTRGYYLSDGVTPDLKRARADMEWVSRVADRKAEAKLKPERERSQADRAAANRAAAYKAVYEDGQPFASQAYLDAAFNSLPANFLADPNVVNATQLIAAGLEFLDLRRNGQIKRGGSSREPMLVEHGGPRRSAEDSELSALELAAARARGKTPEQWAKLQKKVGGSGSLDEHEGGR